MYPNCYHMGTFCHLAYLLTSEFQNEAGKCETRQPPRSFLPELAMQEPCSSRRKAAAELIVERGRRCLHLDRLIVVGNEEFQKFMFFFSSGNEEFQKAMFFF